MDEDRIVAKVWSAPQVDAQQQLRERHELIQAVQILNRAADTPILGESNRFHFRIDAGAGMPVVKVIQKETDEVLYQLPTDHVLQLAREARKRLRACV